MNRNTIAAMLFSASVAISPSAGAADDQASHANHDAHAGHAGHAHGDDASHRGAKSGSGMTRAPYRIPSVNLTSQDGKNVTAREVLSHDGPVVMGFIYTTCTAVCPLTSAVLSRVQEKLGKGQEKVRIVSVSIDPEYDTPERLREYAAKYKAQVPQWMHYTGTRQASVAIQKAFGTYYGDKMNHPPAVFVRAAKSQHWTRFEGFPDAAEVVAALNS